MKYLLTISLFVVLCLHVVAQEQYSKTEIDLKLELQQQQLTAKQSEVEALQREVAIQIAAQDKRVEEAQSHLSMSIYIQYGALSIIIAVLGVASVGFSIFIYKGNQKEVDKGEKRFAKLENDIEKEIESIRKNAEQEIQSAKRDVEDVKKEVEALLEQSKSLVKNIEDNKKTTDQLVDDIKQGKAKTSEVIDEIIDKVEETNKTKPIAQYTANDWFLKAYIGNDVAQENLKENKKDEAIAKFEETCLFYRKATELEPDLESAFNNWGNALADLAELKNDENLYIDAFKKYEKATEIKPDYAKAYYNWGHTLLLLAILTDSVETDKAKIEDKFLTAERQGSKDAAYSLTCLYSVTKDADKAFDWFEKMIATKEYTREKIEEDEDFDFLRNETNKARYDALMANAN